MYLCILLSHGLCPAVERRSKKRMADCKKQDMKQAYGAFAPVYDVFFGPVLEQGRRKAIRGIDLDPGQQILEVGIGTGLSLGAYPPDVCVTGIDLAPAMLDRAQARVERKRWAHVKGLHAMDAADLSFGDDTFDAVIAMYMISVVDDPLRVVQEMRRVCKPGGSLVIVNHFKTQSLGIRAAEALVKPLHRAVRFRADLDLEAFAEQAELAVERSVRANIFGYSTVLYCRNVT